MKGDKSSQDGALAAELIVEKLQGIKGITTKRMFGGNGIFHEGKMFGMVDSKGKYFLKADDRFNDDFLSKGAIKHSRMPYYSIPDEIFANNEELILWAKKSISLKK